ncbi:MAG: hypothetical protein DRP06_04260 [Candidatus Aenigmatarchaeota archaeon]|nr:MAG: hypothetical protein DRP06_04260 [Candidatus Aenigmarchaeota archaeon]
MHLKNVFLIALISISLFSSLVFAQNNISNPDILGKLQLWLESEYTFPNGVKIEMWVPVAVLIIILWFIKLICDYSILKRLERKISG